MKVYMLTMRYYDLCEKRVAVFDTLESAVKLAIKELKETYEVTPKLVHDFEQGIESGKEKMTYDDDDSDLHISWNKADETFTFLANENDDAIFVYPYDVNTDSELIEF